MTDLQTPEQIAREIANTMRVMLPTDRIAGAHRIADAIRSAVNERLEMVETDILARMGKGGVPSKLKALDYVRSLKLEEPQP